MLNFSINVRKDLQACLCLLFVLTLQLLITIWSEIGLNCGNITSVKAVGTVLGWGGQKEFALQLCDLQNQLNFVYILAVLLYNDLCVLIFLGNNCPPAPPPPPPVPTAMSVQPRNMNNKKVHSNNDEG